MPSIEKYYWGVIENPKEPKKKFVDSFEKISMNPIRRNPIGQKRHFKMILLKGRGDKMIDGNIYRMMELRDSQDTAYIEKAILDVLKEQKVSLSQVRVIFNHILIKIEDKNIINL